MPQRARLVLLLTCLAVITLLAGCAESATPAATAPSAASPAVAAAAADPTPTLPAMAVTPASTPLVIYVTPAPTATPVPTPSPSPTPTLAPTPAARPRPPPRPTRVTVTARGAGHSISCNDDVCQYEPPGGRSPWRLTWKDVASETGYHVYVAYDGWYFDPESCAVFIHTPRRLIATVSANRTSLDGVWTPEGDGTKAHPVIVASTYYVRAFNDAGKSKPGASRTISYVEGGPNCVP